MKRIAIFQRDLGPGGIQKSVINLLNNLDYDQYQIDLYLFKKNDFFKNKTPAQVNIKYLKSLPKYFSFIPFYLVKLFYFKQVKEKYDITIDFDGYNLDTALNALKTRSRKKIIWIHNNFKEKRINEFKFKVLWFFNNYKYKYFDYGVTVSEGIKKPFETICHSKKIKLITIPNIIDEHDIDHKLRERLDFKFNPDKYNLVTIGRLCHAKGYDIMLNYIYEIKKNKPHVMLHIISDGQDRRKIEKLIKNLDLSSNVELLGHQANPFPYLREADGYIMTSRYEGQGMVILEAYKVGLPIFIEEHLKIYLPQNLEVHTNIVEDITNAHKQKLSQRSLREYNQGIINSINELLQE